MDHDYEIDMDEEDNEITEDEEDEDEADNLDALDRLLEMDVDPDDELSLAGSHEDLFDNLKLIADKLRRDD